MDTFVEVKDRSHSRLLPFISYIKILSVRTRKRARRTIRPTEILLELKCVSPIYITIRLSASIRKYSDIF